MRKQELVEITLKIAYEDMQEALQEKEIFRVATGTGVLHFLVESLAEDLLTKEQYQRVKEITKMHNACLYGEEIVYGTKDTDHPALVTRDGLFT